MMSHDLLPSDTNSLQFQCLVRFSMNIIYLQICGIFASKYRNIQSIKTMNIFSVELRLDSYNVLQTRIKDSVNNFFRLTPIAVTVRQYKKPTTFFFLREYPLYTLQTLG